MISIIATADIAREPTLPDALWLAPASTAGARLLLAALGQPCQTCGAAAGRPCRLRCGDTAIPASQADLYPQAARSALPW